MPPELIVAAAAAILAVATWRHRTTPENLSGWPQAEDMLLTWTLAASAFILMVAGFILGLPRWVG